VPETVITSILLLGNDTLSVLYQNKISKLEEINVAVKVLKHHLGENI